MNEADLPRPGSALAPKYWRDETGGELVPAMERYIKRKDLSLRDLVLIRAYLRQWIESPAWDLNPHSDEHSAANLKLLRESATKLFRRADIEEWIRAALEIGIDPL
jgi:hypothetical protein